MTQWYGMLAPQHDQSPRGQAGRRARQGRQGAGRANLQGDAAEAIGSTPQQFAQFIASEQTRWQKVLKRAQVKPD